MDTIYTVGDAEFLYNVLVAVAAIFGIGHEDDLNSLFKTAMLLGVIIVMLQGLRNGAKQFNVAYILLSLIIYMGAFVPKTTVYVEDVYTGTVRVVDDIPLGVAIVGATTSKIGITVSQWFDQAFSFPSDSQGFSQGGYITALNVITGLTTDVSNLSMWPSANAAGGGNFYQSWNNYLTDCTLVGVDQDFIDIKDIFSGQKFLDSVDMPSVSLMTEINLNGTVQAESCADAYDLLVIKTQATGSTDVMSLLKQDLASTIWRGESPVGKSVSDTDARLGSLMEAVGLSAYGTNEFLASAMLMPIYEKASSNKFSNDQQVSASAMVQQGIVQRNIQWAAEQSIFFETVRPMIAIFEGMVYALAPVAAVLSLVATFGLPLVGKYLMTLFWVQLWMPILCIANFYVMNSVYQMTAEADSLYGSLLSYGGMMYIKQEFMIKMSLGAKMAASAPALAAFLCFGSSVALTNLANKMEGGDHLNEKMMAPDLHSTQPLVNRAAQMDANTVDGGYSAPLNSQLSKLSFGTNFSQVLNGASEEARQASETYQDAKSTALSNMYQDGSINRVGRAISRDLSNSNQNVTSAINSFTDTASRTHGMNETDARQAAANVAAGVSANLSPGKILQMADAGLVRDLEKTPGIGKEGAKKIMDGNFEDVAEQKALGKAMNNYWKGQGNKDKMLSPFYRLVEANLSAGVSGTVTSGSQDTRGVGASAQIQAVHQSMSNSGLTSTLKDAVDNSKSDFFQANLNSQNGASVQKAKDASISASDTVSNLSQISRNAGMHKDLDASQYVSKFTPQATQDLSTAARNVDSGLYNAKLSWLEQNDQGAWTPQQRATIASVETLLATGGKGEQMVYEKYAESQGLGLEGGPKPALEIKDPRSYYDNSQLGGGTMNTVNGSLINTEIPISGAGQFQEETAGYANDSARVPDVQNDSVTSTIKSENSSGNREVQSIADNNKQRVLDSEESQLPRYQANGLFETVQKGIYDALDYGQEKIFGEERDRFKEMKDQETGVGASQASWNRALPQIETGANN